MAKILIIEDDVDLTNTLKTLLSYEQHNVEVLHDGQEASDHLRIYHYDLLIIDWGLPNKSGLDVCKEFRAAGGTTPVLMLTGKDSVESKIHGLDSGADDYVTKPFHMQEIPPRIRALLRRPANTKQNLIAHGDLEIDSTKRTVTKAGIFIILTKREFQVLDYLMRNPGQVFTYETLLNRVWPTSSDATAVALRTTMKRLRQKVDPDSKLLRTVHGVGYIFETEQG
ncbi:response regulator transcription factor [soil metagenome]